MAVTPETPLPETVALRFRDFGVDTIDEHNRIASERGTVWWGWWNKPDERTPRAVLSAFDAVIQRRGELEIFLVDSGHEKLYRAKLAEIRLAHALRDDEVQQPPFPDLVPPYYRERSWRLWLRFAGQIEYVGDGDVADAVIAEWSYQEVSASVFVDDPHIASYDQKRVHGIREMLSRRHRTMYFLRGRRDGDREGLVELVAPDFPRAFATEARQTRSNHIVLLSDLHFSTDRTQHGYPLVSGIGDPDLLEVLDEDRTTCFGGDAPAAVILSGDLTWRGTAEQFEEARTFISRLQSIWGLDWSQIIVIPGNHDITWLTGAAPGPARPEAEAAYRTFLSQALRFTPEDQLSIGRRFLLGNFIAVDIVALNSVRLESEAYRGYGYVGADQARAAFAAMGWERGEDAGPKLRVLVLHHHVVPVIPVEPIQAERYSLTLDAGELLRTALEYGVDLIIHGHQHQPFAATFSRMSPANPDLARRLLPIHGLGSVGVARDHLPGTGRNAYSVLRIDPEGVTLEVRERSEEHGHAFREAWNTRLLKSTHGLRPEVMNT